MTRAKIVIDYETDETIRRYVGAIVRRGALSQSDREDALQEAFLGAWLALRTYDASRGATRTTWAVYGAKSRVSSLIRAVAIRRKYRSDAPVPDVSAREESVEVQLHWARLRAQSHKRAVTKTDDLVYRRLISGASASEIASELGVTRQRVSQRMTRMGLPSLRDFLA